MAQGLRHCFVTCVILVTLAACGLPGTETGNPIDEPGAGEETPGTGSPGTCPAFTLSMSLASANQASDALDAAEQETELDELIQRLCLSIFLCDPLIGTLECIDTLNGEAGDTILNEFGIVLDDFLTVDEVNTGLRNGNILVDPDAFETCKSDLLTIDCTDVNTHVNSADFSSVENIIPESCTGVFSDLPVPSDGDAGAICP